MVILFAEDEKSKAVLGGEGTTKRVECEWRWEL